MHRKGTHSGVSSIVTVSLARVGGREGASNPVFCSDFVSQLG